MPLFSRTVLRTKTQGDCYYKADHKGQDEYDWVVIRIDSQVDLHVPNSGDICLWNGDRLERHLFHSPACLPGMGQAFVWFSATSKCFFKQGTSMKTKTPIANSAPHK